jgi:hypothetical protein
MDWFNMVPIVFSRCFGKKWVENEFLKEKNNPIFPATIAATI